MKYVENLTDDELRRRQIVVENDISDYEKEIEKMNVYLQEIYFELDRRKELLNDSR